MVLLLLSGCALLVGPTPEPVTIFFAHPSVNTGHYEELLPVFNEQYPHITVEFKSVRTQGDMNRLREGGADVFELYPGYFSSVQEEGVLLALTSFIEQDDAFDLPDFYSSAVDLVTVEGELWGIPSGIECGVMVYNKDLFDQYGVPYPQNGWTWDDFVATGVALRDPGAGVYGFAPQILDPMYFEWAPYLIDPLYFVYQHGGRIFDDWERPTRTTFDDPLTIEAVGWYAKLIHDYDVTPSPQEAARLFGYEGSPGYIYWRGKAGMYMGFLSDRGGEAWGPQAKWRMRWGTVPLPRDERASTLGIVLGYAVSSDTEYPKACWEWLTFLSEQMPPYVMPARRSLAESHAYAELVGSEVAAAARASIENALIFSDVRLRNLEQQVEGFGDAMEEIMNGDVTAMEALIELQRHAESQ